LEANRYSHAPVGMVQWTKDVTLLAKYGYERFAAVDGPLWRDKPTVAGLWWIPSRGVEQIREQHLPSWAENIEPIYGPLPDQPKGGA
jgi:hypothetical protein